MLIIILVLLIISNQTTDSFHTSIRTNIIGSNILKKLKISDDSSSSSSDSILGKSLDSLTVEEKEKDFQTSLDNLLAEAKWNNLLAGKSHSLTHDTLSNKS